MPNHNGSQYTSSDIQHARLLKFKEDLIMFKLTTAPNTKRDLSVALKTMRENHGFTQRSASNASGISIQSISCYERLIRNPSLKHIKILSKLYAEPTLIDLYFLSVGFIELPVHPDDPVRFKVARMLSERLNAMSDDECFNIIDILSDQPQRDPYSCIGCIKPIKRRRWFICPIRDNLLEHSSMSGLSDAYQGCSKYTK